MLNPYIILFVCSTICMPNWASHKLKSSLVPRAPKIFADKDIRTMENWLNNNARAAIQYNNATIPLKWDGLMYHLVMPILTIPRGVTSTRFCRVKGLHHDYQGTLEKTGLIKVCTKAQSQDVIYDTAFTYAGVTKQSSFFPKDWTPRTLAQAIAYASKNAKISHNQYGFELRGISAQAIHILILINNHGQVITAYPVKNT